MTKNRNKNKIKIELYSRLQNWINKYDFNNILKNIILEKIYDSVIHQQINDSSFLTITFSLMLDDDTLSKYKHEFYPEVRLEINLKLSTVQEVYNINFNNTVINRNTKIEDFNIDIYYGFL